MAIVNSRLGDLLIERHLITSAQLEDAVCKQQHSQLQLGEILIQHKVLSAKQLRRTLKIQKELRNTILSTFICLVPFQLACADENKFYAQMPSEVISSPYKQNPETKLSLSFSSIIKGFDYLFSNTNTYPLKENQRYPNIQTSSYNMNIRNNLGTNKNLNTNYDFSLGKDSFSIEMKLSF